MVGTPIRIDSLIKGFSSLWDASNYRNTLNNVLPSVETPEILYLMVPKVAAIQQKLPSDLAPEFPNSIDPRPLNAIQHRPSGTSDAAPP